MELIRRNALVLFVDDSEYNNFTGTQPTPPIAVSISFCPWRAAVAAAAVFLFLLLLLRAPPPHPAPLLGGGKYQKKSPAASALAVGTAGHVCVGVGEVGFLFDF
jgi:hypothetical protein